MRTSLVASVLSGSLVLLPLAGCSSDSEPSSEQTQQTASPSVTGSTEPSPTEATGSPAPQSDEESSAAFVDRLQEGFGEEGSVHVVLRTDGAVESRAEGDTVYGPDGSKIRLRMKMGGVPGTLQVLLVDDRVYLSLPGLMGRGKYFKVDGGDQAFSAFQGGLSPSDSFSAIESGLERVEEVGPDQVGGDPTTHYRLYVDSTRAFDGTGQAAARGLPDTLVYDIWLDDEDRVRRLAYERGGTTITMDLSDWGEDVTIKTPGKGDLVQAPPLLGG